MEIDNLLVAARLKGYEIESEEEDCWHISSKEKIFRSGSIDAIYRDFYCITKGVRWCLIVSGWSDYEEIYFDSEEECVRECMRRLV